MHLANLLPTLFHEKWSCTLVKTSAFQSETTYWIPHFYLLWSPVFFLGLWLNPQSDFLSECMKTDILPDSGCCILHWVWDRDIVHYLITCLLFQPNVSFPYCIGISFQCKIKSSIEVWHCITAAYFWGWMFCMVVWWGWKRGIVSIDASLACGHN